MDHSSHSVRATRSDFSQEESLLAILKRRYALGEITREQFEEMKRVLELEVGSVAQSNEERRHH
jgi:uncharacterized membrane protein